MIPEREQARKNARGDIIAGGQAPTPNAIGAHDIFYRDAIEDAAYARVDQRLNQISGMLSKQRDAVWAVWSGKHDDDWKRQHVNDIVGNMLTEAQTASAEMAAFAKEHPRK